LKDGKIIPVKATIVGVYGPEDMDDAGYPVLAGGQYPNDWKKSTLKVDEIGVLSDVIFIAISAAEIPASLCRPRRMT
jgi:hypothetical protein